jgi:hypothetical protein
MQAKQQNRRRVSRLIVSITLGVCSLVGVRAQDVLPARPPAGGAQQAAPPPEAPLVTEGVTFAPVMQFDKGQTRRYGAQSSMTLRFSGQNGAASNFVSTTTMGLALRYKVRDTKPDGTSLLSVISEGGRILDATGAFQNVAREPENTARLLTLDRQSRIIAFKDQTARKANGGLDALFSQSNLLVPLQILPLPDKPVRVGESWSATYATPGKAAPSGNAGTDGIESDVKATLTLLGSQKIADVATMKIKQVLTVPYVAYTDAQGKLVDARNAKGRMNMLLTFTQVLNALPENGLLVRSEGTVSGTITFEGALLNQVPGSTMTISGKMIAVRLEDTPPPEPAAK